ncbi:hypothetical protein BU17DRAFT_75830 [Hysterangium stoloniferum]|nr:hypothetical protein BU17DRAFT_75830 [Hysterangium stoloniferum]
MPPNFPALKILIVGGGMGGLSAALSLSQRGFTNITVFESSSRLADVGAGLNVTPNLSRLLDRWNVLDIVKQEGVALEGANIYKARTDETLSRVKYSYAEKEFGHPLIVAHRSTLQQALFVGCERSGVVQFQLNTPVLDVDFEQARVKIRCMEDDEYLEEWIDGDVVIAADGIKSFIRAAMLARLGIQDEVEDTGQAAYRILLRRAQVLEHPELLELLDSNETHRWIGHQRLIMSYPISSHKIYNISTAHPDTNFAESPGTSWTTRGAKSKMLEIYKDFCPRVQALLKLVPDGDICEWKLRVHQPLPTWVDGRVALLGDACHPALPHLGQGAAQAIEDSAVLAIALSQIHHEGEINKALRIYQAGSLRKDRTEDCIARAAANGRELHLSDEDAKDRDRRFREANKEGGENPDKSADKQTQELLFGHDCEEDAFKRWGEFWSVQF